MSRGTAGERRSTPSGAGSTATAPGQTGADPSRALTGGSPRGRRSSSSLSSSSGPRSPGYLRSEVSLKNPGSYNSLKEVSK